MRRFVVLVGVVGVLLAPLGGLLLVAVLLLGSTEAGGCAAGTGSTSVGAAGAVPRSVSARTAAGVAVTVGSRQLAQAAVILAVAGRTAGVGARGARIAVMAAWTESGLRSLANPAVPQSLSARHDGVGSDHDSLGLFQMRASSGWGRVGQLMDPTYQAEAFFGGPGGPNRGSPAGLLDVPGWSGLTDGQAAQAVEVSAFPARYTDAGPVADRIITALTSRTHPVAGSMVPVGGGVVFPLPAGTWTMTARFGPRIDPITGRPGFHHGTDLAAAAGTPIRAATGGRVVVAGMVAGTGTITVLSGGASRVTAVTYLHMTAAGIGVRVGEVVTAGEVIGAVGSSGHSTGPHLHFQVQPGGVRAGAVDSLQWLRSHHATATTGTGTGTGTGVSAGCG